MTFISLLLKLFDSRLGQAPKPLEIIKSSLLLLALLSVASKGVILASSFPGRVSKVASPLESSSSIVSHGCCPCSACMPMQVI